jgi:hypothetical protein
VVHCIPRLFADGYLSSDEEQEAKYDECLEILLNVAAAPGFKMPWLCRELCAT